MRVLIVGNANITGRTIAMRFHKEGHSVFWLTEANEENLFENNEHGKSYHQDIEMSRIKSLFIANSIDTVIFLGTSYLNEKIEHTKEVSYLLPKLSNILEISTSCNIQSFVFLSDVGLINDIDDVKYMYLKSSEELCSFYQNTSTMKMNIVRLPMIYGKAPYSQLGMLGTILEQVATKNSIKLPFNSSSKLHLLDSRDMADAIYRLIVEEVSGVWTLGVSRPISTNEFMRILELESRKSLHFEFAEGTYPTINKEDVYAIKNNLGWVVLHDFSKESSFLKELFKENIIKHDEVETPTVSMPESLRDFIENILLFCVVVLVSHVISGYSDFRYIDLKLIYVVLVAAFYGKLQSILAMFLACAHQAWQIHQAGIDISYLFYSIESWTPFAMYILGGSSIGYLFDKKRDELDTIKNEEQIISKKYYFLKEVYKDVCEVKDQLQKQIVVSKDSFGRVYEITRELDTLQPELIFFKTVLIMENIMGANCVSIYTIHDNQLNYARLIAHSTKLSGKLNASLRFDEYPELKRRMLDGKMFVNKELIPNYPAYAAPIMDGESFIAMVVIQDVEFQKFTLYYQNLFQIVCGLVQNNVIKAYKYSQKGLESRYINNTIIYKTKEFNEQLRVVENARENIKLSYILCKATDKLHLSLEEFSPKIARLLRSTDFIGMGEDGNYYIVFMQTDKSNMNIIYNRFIAQDIELEVS